MVVLGVVTGVLYRPVRLRVDEQGEVVVLAPRQIEELRQAVGRHHEVQRWIAP